MALRAVTLEMPISLRQGALGGQGVVGLEHAPLDGPQQALRTCR